MEHPLEHERLIKKISQQEFNELMHKNNGKKWPKRNHYDLECWDLQTFNMYIMDTEKFSEDCFTFKIAFSGNVPPEFYENIIALNQQNGRRE